MVKKKKVPHLSEFELDVLAQRKVFHPKKKIIRGVEHIRQCRRCREYFDHLVKTYQQFQKIQYDVPLESEKQKVQALIASNVITLHPVSFTPTLKDLGLENDAVLLAADVGSAVPRVQLLTSFISTQPRIVVRVLDNQRNNTYDFYILSEDSTVGVNTTLRILSEDGFVTEIKSNSEGIATLERAHPIDWQRCHLVLSRSN